MKKGFLIIAILGLTLMVGNISLAAPSDITPTTYNITAGNIWYDVINGNVKTYDGFGTSTHPQGTWNSPYTLGVDGYNYNDAQDYTEETGWGGSFSGGKYTAGPHGGYVTTSHRCRECHAVHRAAGKFKLTRASTRYETCDWCHGFGAGSGFNIQTDNDDNSTTEYNVGHSLGFGISTGKWKAPDDTFPAYTPNYWLGGLSCFDCHSPHANPQRLLGFNNVGNPVGISGSGVDSDDPLGRDQSGLVFSIADPGHDTLGNNTQLWNSTANKDEPIYLAGSWLLIKDPDREVSAKAGTETVSFWNLDTGSADTTQVAPGAEIPDVIASLTISGTDYGWMNMYDNSTPYPVNKVPIDWNNPIGAADSSTVGSENIGFTSRNAGKPVWSISEFCTDCHDGNAGLHTVQAPLFSEDRALRNQQPQSGTDTVTWKGEYDLAYGHDAQPRH